MTYHYYIKNRSMNLDLTMKIHSHLYVLTNPAETYNSAPDLCCSISFWSIFSQQPDSSPCQSSLHDRINVKRFQCPRHFTRLVIDSWAMLVNKYTNYAKFMHQKGRTIIGSYNCCSLLYWQPLTMLISKFMKPPKLHLVVVISYSLSFVGAVFH